MQKYFNITGICYPEKHYMVNLERRLKEIQKLIDRGDYFVINRARLYLKTTTLWALKQYLQIYSRLSLYGVLSLQILR